MFERISLYNLCEWTFQRFIFIFFPIQTPEKLMTFQIIYIFNAEPVIGVLKKEVIY